ncbi:MAG: hypothetical protein JNJ77_20130 [Planctomycetia bacterium]|nr:hypothetical protein [Planctomycetia bacterium]
MAAAVPTILYCARSDMEAKLSAYSVQGALDENADGIEDTNSAPRINQARYHGTNRVNLYLLSKYTAEELALSPIACEWAVVKACCWLMGRRGNPVPAGLAAECAEAEALMKEIRDGEAELPDAAPRVSSLPSHTNIRIDRNYRYGKQRVIRPESDDTTPDHPQRIDRGAEFYPY